MAINKIENYHDALYHIKRGFLIIGLTGYTGSGCSTFANLLVATKKPKFATQPESSANHSNTLSNEGLINTLINERLKDNWSRTEWTSFKKIEVSKIIFAFCVIRSLNAKKPHSNPFINSIQNIISATSSINRSELKALGYLNNGVTLDKPKALALIKAINISSRIYGQFKNNPTTNDQLKGLHKFISFMQDRGDEIRKYGMPFPSKKIPDPKNLFVLPESIRRLIKSFRIADNSTHFVIDSFRNAFEVEYFQRRYSEFYLLSILRDANERSNSLKTLTPDEIALLGKRENGDVFDADEKKTNKNISKWISALNVDECIRKGDVYINNIKDESGTYPNFRFHIAKLLSLISEPGCIPPTNDERSMQLAMTARQMSGCISRRVGAVVTDKDGYLAGMGWNNPPEGQIPCSLRTAKCLAEDPKDTIFSKYEQSEKFVSHIKKLENQDRPFCFREELNTITGKKYGEFTRALHGEENALFQASRSKGELLTDSTLYTTDRTCNLCAKKAYQLGVKRIVYVEDYTDIAIKQTIEAGNRIITIERFEGIIGSAYFRLFAPIMAEKDVIKLFSPGSPALETNIASHRNQTGLAHHRIIS